MHKCLSGVSNYYLYAWIRQKTESIDEAFVKMERRFSSKQHHFQALTYLKWPSFKRTKYKKSCFHLEVHSIANERI